MTMAQSLAVTEFARVSIPFQREQYRTYNSRFVCLNIGDRYVPAEGLNGALLFGVWEIWN
jgi:hypothetical protein